MVCYSPLKVYRSRRLNKATGKYPIKFSPRSTYTDIDGLFIPCGKCEGCLLARSFQWSLRCVCETYSHSESYFLTLTYDEEHLPEGRNLCRAHFQGFMKRLRWHFRGYKLKVFYCGEYGEKRNRPHYHAIIFGLPLSRENIRLFPLNVSRKGNTNYYSPILNKIWSYGNVTVGDCNCRTCAYVAQYTLKKNKSNVNVPSCKVKPFVGASNRSAIGTDFFFKYYEDIFVRGFFNPFSDSKNSGRLYKPPRFFVKLLEKHFPLVWFKYVELPKRIEIHRRRMLWYRDRALFASQLDEKLKMRYYKERQTLRRLEARRDLL